MNEEVGHRAFDKMLQAWAEFACDQTWEGVRTLKFALEKAMIGNKPDPQGDGDGEIVKLVKKKNAVIDGLLGKDKNTKIINEISEEFARAIEAEIEGVRKLFRNHEKRIDANKTDLFGLAVNFNKHTDRVEELDEKFKVHQEVHSFKPGFPSPGVAWDKDGNKLRRGTVAEVTSSITKDHVVCLEIRKNDPDRPVCQYVSGECTGKSWAIHRSQLTRLFDLPFPGGGTQ